MVTKLGRQTFALSGVLIILLVVSGCGSTRPAMPTQDSTPLARQRAARAALRFATWLFAGKQSRVLGMLDRTAVFPEGYVNGQLRYWQRNKAVVTGKPQVRRILSVSVPYRSVARSKHQLTKNQGLLVIQLVGRPAGRYLVSAFQAHETSAVLTYVP